MINNKHIRALIRRGRRRALRPTAKLWRCARTAEVCTAPRLCPSRPPDPSRRTWPSTAAGELVRGEADAVLVAVLASEAEREHAAWVIDNQYRRLCPGPLFAG